jgi:hypothetical protein
VRIRGLIKYSIYSATGSLIVLFLMTLLVGIVAALINDPLMYETACFFGIMLFPFSLVLSKPKDTLSKWNRFQLALPVKRKDIINSHYIGHLIMQFMGIIITAVIIAPGVIINNIPADIIIESILFIVPLSIGASLVGCGLYYPIVYAVGDNKEEAIALISMIVPAFMIGFILGYERNIEYDMSMIIPVFSIIISLILFVISYVITKKIYAKKDI